MLSRKELARLRKIRKFLRTMARGVGAAAARNELDDWIDEEKALGDIWKRTGEEPG